MLLTAYLQPQKSYTVNILLPCLAVTHTHTHTHTHKHTHSKIPLNEYSAHRKSRSLQNAQRTQETNIPGLNGIRTRDPSNQAVSDLRLRSHGHRDLHYPIKYWIM